MSGSYKRRTAVQLLWRVPNNVLCMVRYMKVSGNGIFCKKKTKGMATGLYAKNTGSGLAHLGLPWLVSSLCPQLGWAPQGHVFYSPGHHFPRSPNCWHEPSLMPQSNWSIALLGKKGHLAKCSFYCNSRACTWEWVRSVSAAAKAAVYAVWDPAHCLGFAGISVKIGRAQVGDGPGQLKWHSVSCHPSGEFLNGYPFWEILGKFSGF
jgi:hypothetical protein